MKVEGTREFEASVVTVWDVLMDPSRISKLLPGVQDFEVQDDSHWSASVKVPLGMGGLKLKFAFEKAEERPMEYAKLKAKGQGVGAIVNANNAVLPMDARVITLNCRYVYVPPVELPDQEK